MKTFVKLTSVLAVAAIFVLAGMRPAHANPNLLTNGNFSGGNTGFTSSYTFTNFNTGNVSGAGTYTIGSEPCLAAGHFSDWGCFGGPPPTPSASMLIANGALGTVWSESVSVMPNTTYTFSFWGAEIDATSSSLPDLALDINGILIGSSLFPAHSPSAGGSWEQFTFTWNSGSNTSATLALADLNGAVDFNDFAITDFDFSAASTPSATPEPGTLSLIATGLLGLGAAVRRRFA